MPNSSVCKVADDLGERPAGFSGRSPRTLQLHVGSRRRAHSRRGGVASVSLAWPQATDDPLVCWQEERARGARRKPRLALGRAPLEERPQLPDRSPRSPLVRRGRK